MLDMSVADMDLWASQNIGYSRCKNETALYQTKWFDYRLAHPLVATCLFTEAYKAAYAQIMLTHGRDDFRTAPFRTGLKRIPYQEQSIANRTSLWKARQTADQYCCTYEYFITTILSIAASRLWNELPRPQHLWQESLLEIFEDKLAKRSKTRVDDSMVSFHNMPHQGVVEVQKSYYESILGHLSSLSSFNRTLAIFSLVFLRQLLPDDLVMRHFPYECREARAMAD